MGQFQRIIKLSGIRKKNLFRIPVPRVKKAPDPGSGSGTLIYLFFDNENHSKIIYVFSAELSGTTESRYGILIDLVQLSSCVADPHLIYGSQYGYRLYLQTYQKYSSHFKVNLSDSKIFNYANCFIPY